MAKKTSVLLPGGIQGLVNDLQNGTSNFQPRPLVDSNQAVQEAAQNDEPADNGKVAEPVAEEREAYGKQAEQQTAKPQQPATVSEEKTEQGGGEKGPQGRGRRPKENTMKTYQVVKDDSQDSWDLFLDMAQQYKQGGGKLATIYIDETLKAVLDRMKYAGTEKFSTSAILSSIVARFIYDHEEDIKAMIYNQRLI